MCNLWMKNLHVNPTFFSPSSKIKLIKIDRETPTGLNRLKSVQYQHTLCLNELSFVDFLYQFVK